jgi:hypothetical protein
MDPVHVPRSRDQLVVILLRSRRRLHDGDGDGDQGHLLAEDLALELDHDRMLIRLCAALGIESDASRFVNPLVERARLDALLRQRGIDFRTFDDDRREAKAQAAATGRGGLSAG